MRNWSITYSLTYPPLPKENKDDPKDEDNLINEVTPKNKEDSQLKNVDNPKNEDEPHNKSLFSQLSIIFETPLNWNAQERNKTSFNNLWHSVC